ncbi:capsid cement protein [Luteococcus japonicus]|uniref:Phage protein n=1 Tax=Luteococcus japonicus LSP_Lj1 TaxID=1255658 RepID=A0A1R4K501_9ACTN|nr:capsid cement protein [Luteococcus japonicus]SJN39397.1 Phage protein [Luteococcus japonicus LSP_Lj1]
MTEYLPTFQPGNATTFHSSAPITGGQLLAIGTSGLVAPTTGATHAVVGVAGFDVKAGQQITVYAGGIHQLVATTAITAGQLVEAAGNGTIAPHAVGTADVNAIGLALTSAQPGQTARVKLA